MPVELSFDRFDGTADGPRVVVLHGLFGSKRNWRAVARDFAARDLAVRDSVSQDFAPQENVEGPRATVFTVDLRHHGDSPNQGPFNLEEMAADVCAFIETAAAGGPVTLLGHSLGGKVAVLALQQRPQLIERLILVDITPFRLPEALCSELQEVVAALQELQAGLQSSLQSSPAALESRRAAEELLERRIASPEVVQFLLHNLRRSDEGRLQLQLGVEAIAADFAQSCREVLPEGGPSIAAKGTSENGENGEEVLGAGKADVQEGWRDVPLCTISGGGSGYMPAEHFEALSRWFRRQDHRTIENAGHWLHVEQKEEFLHILGDVFGGFAGKA